MIRVMVAGLPGKMATLIANALEKAEDMELHNFGLSEERGTVKIGELSLTCVELSAHEGTIKNTEPDIIIDFTAPSAVNRNAELYCNCAVPFVMGTTGGDRELLKKTVESSKICAVIAPNMAKQIVAFQAMMDFAAKNFPNVFKGYNLTIFESHQQGKKDTSGTAKAMVQYFNTLGVPFTVDQIIMERNPIRQEAFYGVPKEYLEGHAYHTYKLLSEDETVLFQFRHCVNGRNIYIPGILDSIRFLNKNVQGGAQGTAYSMIDVLKG